MPAAPPGPSLEVYQTDAEAFEATAELAAQVLRAASGERPSVALSGGRSGRGVMVALAARSDVRWDRVEWFWSDERCVPADDPHSNVKVAHDSLFGPRAVAAARIHPPPTELGDPSAIAAAYAAQLAAILPVDGVPIFDLVLLGLTKDGGVASLVPGCAALGADGAVAGVSAAEVGTEPKVARVTLTPPVLRAARRVIVTVAGSEKARALAAALRDGGGPERVPARLVVPSERVTWIVDRAAAGELLRDAQPVAQ